MSLARTLEAMMAAGCSAEQLVAVARAHEAVEQDRIDLRRAADAERQRRSRMSRNVTVTPRDGRDEPSPKKETSPEPPKEKTTPSISEASLPRFERKHAWPDDFCEQVWSIFPKHVEKKAGIEALKVLHRADRLDWQTLTNAITSLAATCDPQFVPALHRWIKGERWTDQRTITKPGAGCPPQRRTFAQIARESAAEAAGYPDDQHSNHQADDHRGPTLGLVPSGSGADLVDLQSHRAGRGAW